MSNRQSLDTELSAITELNAEGAEDEDQFQQRINELRMQLDDTYNIFVNARETLSTISFENLSERLNANKPESVSSSHADGDQSQQNITLVRDARDQIDVVKSLEQLNSLPSGSQLGTPMENIPELNKFFKVISDLTEGIKKINGHQQSITELVDDMNSLGEQSTHSTGTETSLSEQVANMSMDSTI